MLRLFNQNPNSQANPLEDSYQQKNNESFSMTAKNREVIYKTIPPLNTNISCRPDKHSNQNSAPCSRSNIEHLANICNLFFSTGIFPSTLKTDKVIPIHKGNSKLEVSNYRSISLLSNIDKICEKQMHSRLIEFHEKRQILHYKGKFEKISQQTMPF